MAHRHQPHSSSGNLWQLRSPWSWLAGRRDLKVHFKVLINQDSIRLNNLPSFDMAYWVNVSTYSCEGNSGLYHPSLTSLWKQCSWLTDRKTDHSIIMHHASAVIICSHRLIPLSGKPILGFSSKSRSHTISVMQKSTVTGYVASVLRFVVQSFSLCIDKMDVVQSSTASKILWILCNSCKKQNWI